MSEPKRILAVVDPTATDQPAVERAAQLATALGAALEIFICAYDQYLSGERFFNSAALEEARDRYMNAHRRRLEELAKPLRERGLEVSIDARWDHPLDEGIVRKVTEARPILVAKDTHYHSALKRTIFSNTDWNLVRSCPAPLLLVKPRQLADRPTVIASVDPLHEHDKSATLDHAIVRTAKVLAQALGGSLHVFHAFDPALAIAVTSDAMAASVAVPVRELTEAMEQRHRNALTKLLSEHPGADEHVHLEQGPTREALVSLAHDLPADFVVMGAVSRSGLSRVFIGSTAERVLDRLPCDLLIARAGEGELRA